MMRDFNPVFNIQISYSKWKRVFRILYQSTTKCWVFFIFLLKAKGREEDYPFATYKCMFTITLPKGAQKKKKEVRKALHK